MSEVEGMVPLVEFHLSNPCISVGRPLNIDVQLMDDAEGITDLLARVQLPFSMR